VCPAIAHCSEGSHATVEVFAAILSCNSLLLADTCSHKCLKDLLACVERMHAQRGPFNGISSNWVFQKNLPLQVRGLLCAENNG
jgi:hypothetical protein